jgi:hypothetical protein
MRRMCVWGLGFGEGKGDDRVVVGGSKGEI